MALVFAIFGALICGYAAALFQRDPLRSAALGFILPIVVSAVTPSRPSPQEIARIRAQVWD